MDKNTKCGNSFSQLDCKEHLVMKLFGFAEMFIFFTPVYVDLLCFFCLVLAMPLCASVYGQV